MRHDGSPWEPGIGKYLKLQSSAEEVVDNKFYRYVPEEFSPAKVARISSSESVQAKMRARLDKVRKREVEEAEAGRMNLHASHKPGEVGGHTVKKVRLHSEGFQLAG